MITQYKFVDRNGVEVSLVANALPKAATIVNVSLLDTGEGEPTLLMTLRVTNEQPLSPKQILQKAEIEAGLY